MRLVRERAELAKGRKDLSVFAAPPHNTRMNRAVLCGSTNLVQASHMWTMLPEVRSTSQREPCEVVESAMLRRLLQQNTTRYSIYLDRHQSSTDSDFPQRLRLTKNTVFMEALDGLGACSRLRHHSANSMPSYISSTPAGESSLRSTAWHGLA